MSDRDDRVRRLEGAHNVRDLGGLVTADGREVRRGRIFRSDYPGFADVSEGAAVRDLGLRTVVDLRRSAEASLECVSWEDHGVHYVRCPVSAGGESSWRARYHSYLTHLPETVVEAVRQVTTVEAHPVLFHCAAGKDRTGVVAALVLAVLGVDRGVVVADYTLTAAALEPIMARLMGLPHYAEMLGDSSYEDQVPHARNMETLLDWVDEQGGAERWLVDHGLDADHLVRFRQAMLGT